MNDAGCLNYLPKWVGCIFVAMFMVSCGGEQQKKVDKYFSIPDFIDQQVEILAENQNQLLKTVSFGDTSETTSIDSLSHEQWKKELRIFKEHDINKPVLIDAYLAQETDILGGHTISYKLMDSTDSGILDMEIVYDSAQQVSGWRSRFKEENLLYCNFRELMLSTDGAGILESYLIKGYHKLIFKDTVHYQLNVEIK
jgi:hypothetical protein